MIASQTCLTSKLVTAFISVVSSHWPFTLSLSLHTTFSSVLRGVCRFPAQISRGPPAFESLVCLPDPAQFQDASRSATVYFNTRAPGILSTTNPHLATLRTTNTRREKRETLD
ncbi:hypothetical protein T439DRAFT_88071 [Meredithblackwellia eburnea MCA 4105]